MEYPKFYSQPDLPPDNDLRIQIDWSVRWAVGLGLSCTGIGLGVWMIYAVMQYQDVQDIMILWVAFWVLLGIVTILSMIVAFSFTGYGLWTSLAEIRELRKLNRS